MREAIILLLTKYQQVTNFFHLFKYIKMLQGNISSVHLIHISLGVYRTMEIAAKEVVEEKNTRNDSKETGVA